MADEAPLNIAARAVLLDALEAMQSQRDAVTVVGAQAIYLRTEKIDLSVAPYTTDADFMIAPARLVSAPLFQEILSAAGFTQEGDPGIWYKTIGVDDDVIKVEVDIMVPTMLASGEGRRSARIPPHGESVARKTKGLEGCDIDFDVLDIGSLDVNDGRRFRARVAGPAGLLVAKIHKISDRRKIGNSQRLSYKDAADIFRLMLAVPINDFILRLRPLLSNPNAGPVTREALPMIIELFGSPRSEGVLMATDALRTGIPAEQVVAVCNAFVSELVGELQIESNMIGADYGKAWDEWFESKDGSAWENTAGD